MDATRFDRIGRRLADRRLSRRQALATGGAGLAAAGLTAAGLGNAAAQDATPDATVTEKIPYLFVQSFQSGSIVPTEGADGRYTVTLEQGLGSTIYFADRPSRDVGTTPTPQFLGGLGFSEDNPPNAALLLETAPGETDIAVVELYNPTYDPTTRGVTYEVEVLENWEDSVELGFSKTPADLAALAPAFGTAHLLIDDCDNNWVHCLEKVSYTTVSTYNDVPMCWNYSLCIPCEPYGHTQPSYCATQDYWDQKCTTDNSQACQGGCRADINAFYLC